MTKKKHVHKLKRHIYKNGECIFFCAKDDCSFKINADLTLGKSAECWRCNEPFTMTVQSKRHDKPHCVGCTKGREKSPVNSAKRGTINVSTEAEDSLSNLRSRLSSSAAKVVSSSVSPISPIQDEDML